jgi:Ca-activated chloride channel family protein
MKINPDDPILTAYALGEVDEETRAAIEQALQESPEGQQAVAEVWQTAALLNRELDKEPCERLSEEQRQSVVAGASEQPARAFEPAEDKLIVGPWRRMAKFGAIAAAACLALALTLWHFHFKEAKSTRPLLAFLEKGKQSTSRSVTTPQAVVETNLESQGPALTPVDVSTVTAAVPQATSESGAVISQSSGPVMRRYEPAFLAEPQSAPASEKSFEVLKQSTPAIDPALMNRSRPVPNRYSPSTTAPSLPDSSVKGRNLPSAPVTLQRESPAPSSVGSPPSPQASDESRSKFRMDPQLMRRYGLSPPSSGSPPPASQPQSNLQLLQTGINQQSGQSLGPLTLVESSAVAQPSDTYRLSKQLADDGRSRGKSAAAYPTYVENAFLPTLQNPLSTFSTDVDTASYANIRRFLNQGQMPPRDAVRIEEMVNYFNYSYPQPKSGEPFAAGIEVAGCPWNPPHRLVRISVKARDLAPAKRPPGNLVFLIDVSGSMQPPERLPLIKHALRLLVKRLTDQDRVAIVAYASNSGLVLPSTLGTEKESILAAIDGLKAGGSTNGGDGIQQAYALASQNLIEGGVNRVILCTDGDFNVGITDQSALIRLIQEKARSGVFLSALGVGTDNYKDALMQNLADKGNGNYHYLDTIEEAQKVLLEQMNATLVTVAKDVKIQIEFNPSEVGAYRLIGYEKRLMRAEDFNDDTKDAGEVGAGHAVTALYEIVPADGEARQVVDNLKYQPAPRAERRVTTGSKELLTLKLRYKAADGKESKLLESVAFDSGASYGKASTDFKFAAAVASFGQILRESEYRGTATFDGVLELALEGKGADDGGYRAEFINLVRKARDLNGDRESRPGQTGGLDRIRKGDVVKQDVTDPVKLLVVPLTRETVGLMGNRLSQPDKIVVNLADTDSRGYAVVRVALRLSETDYPKVIQNRERLLERVTGILSRKTVVEIEMPGFKNNLRAELLDSFNQVLGSNTVQEVILTEFATLQ